MILICTMFFQEGNPDLKQDLPVYVECMQFHTKL